MSSREVVTTSHAGGRAVIALTIIGAAHWLVVLALFVHRRKQYPIVGRDLRMSIFLTVAGEAQSLIPLVVDVLTTPCSWFVPVDNFIILLGLVIGLVHTARPWLLYHLASDRVKLAKAKNRKDIMSDKKLNWFIRISRGLKRKRIIANILMITMVPFTIVLVLFAVAVSRDSHDPFEKECQLEDDANLVTRVFAGLIALFYIYSALRLRKVRVAYYLIEELKIIVWAPILYLGRLGLIIAQPDTPKYIPAILLFGVAQIVFVGALDYPLWKSYRSEYSNLPSETTHNSVLSEDGDINLDALEAQTRSRRASKLSKMRSELTLESVLHDPCHFDDMESFCEHMIEELSVEAFLFYYAVHDYETQHKGKSSLPPHAEEENSIDTGPPGELEHVEKKTGGDDTQQLGGKQECGGKQEFGGNKDASAVAADFGVKRYSSALVPRMLEVCENTVSPGECRRQVLARAAVGIFYEFVENDSLQQVNLPNFIVVTVRKALKSCVKGLDDVASRLLDDPSAAAEMEFDVVETPPLDLFTPAKRDTFKLMRKDSFVRWKRKRFADVEQSISAATASERTRGSSFADRARGSFVEKARGSFVEFTQIKMKTAASSPDPVPAPTPTHRRSSFAHFPHVKLKTASNSYPMPIHQ